MRFAALALSLGVTTAGCLKVPEDFSEEPAGAAVAPTTAAELLSRHVDALGGEALLRGLSSRTLEARMVIYPAEGCESEEDPVCAAPEQSGSFLFQNTSDGRLYRRNVIGDGVEERGFDGKIGWVYVAPDTLRIDTDSEAQVNREEAILHWYLDVGARGVETALLSTRQEDSDGGVRTLDGLRWTVDKTAVSKELWFDRATGLRREEVSRDGEGETASSQIVVYEDYREVDGALVPHMIRVTNTFGTRTQRIDFQVQRVTHEALDPAKFAIPELPKPKAEPDALLAQLAGAEVAAREGAPKEVSAWMEFARIAFIAGHFDTAIEASNKALQLDAKEPEALVLQARIAVLQGDYTRATKTLGRAKKANVRDDLLARERGWIHLRKRNYRQLADALDAGGNPALAGRYRSFVGKPLQASLEGNGCSVEVPLVTKAPLAIVDIQIGEQTVGAIFDTGAADLIVTESLAKKLELSVQAKSQLAEGLPDVGHGQLDVVKVGGLTLQNVPANVFDDAAIADMAGDDSKRVSAVLGIGMLTDFAVALDVPQGKLELVPRARKCKAQRDALLEGPSAPFWMHETHYLYVLAQMNEAEGVYLLNTGMRGADMTANQVAYRHAAVGAPPLRADEAPMAIVNAFGIGSAPPHKDISAAWGYFQQTQSSDGFRLDGMIGLGVLGRSRFVLDFDAHRIHFPPQG